MRQCCLVCKGLHVCRLRLAETIKFGGNPQDPFTRVNAAANVAEGPDPSQEPFSGMLPVPLQLNLMCCSPLARCPARLRRAGCPADFPLTTTVLVLGPLGCGKSATINRILDERLCPTSATGRGTSKARPALPDLWQL